MITIGVISDTHGVLVDKRAKNLFPKDAKIITLGDISNRELGILKKHFVVLGGVMGNCDVNSPLPVSDTIEIENVRIFLSHKPLKINITSRSDDWEMGYDIVLFGHLHERRYQKNDGLVYFNPGAISGPRDNLGPSVGIIEIRDGGFDLRHVDVFF